MRFLARGRRLALAHDCLLRVAADTNGAAVWLRERVSHFFWLSAAPKVVNASVTNVTDPSRPHAVSNRGSQTRGCADECVHMAAPGAPRITQAQCRAGTPPPCAPHCGLEGTRSAVRGPGRGRARKRFVARCRYGRGGSWERPWWPLRRFTRWSGTTSRRFWPLHRRSRPRCSEAINFHTVTVMMLRARVR